MQHSQPPAPSPYYHQPAPAPVQVVGQVGDDIDSMRGDLRQAKNDLAHLRHNVGIIAFWFKVFTAVVAVAIMVGAVRLVIELAFNGLVRKM